MLTENMRILSGLQESQIKTDPLDLFLKEEENREIVEKTRKINEHKVVASNFDLFNSTMNTYKTMIETVCKIFEDKNSKEFINGILEHKYTNLQHFASIVLNQTFMESIQYLDKNYYHILDEMKSIEYITESINESEAECYFVSNNIISDDIRHNIRVRLFKNRDLTERISDEINYGAQLIIISENCVIIKDSGKKRYSSFSSSEIKKLLSAGFII